MAQFRRNKLHTMEIAENVLKAIQLISDRGGMKRKFVTDQLMRYALFHVEEIFPNLPKQQPKENPK